MQTHMMMLVQLLSDTKSKFYAQVFPRNDELVLMTWCTCLLAKRHQKTSCTKTAWILLSMMGVKIWNNYKNKNVWPGYTSKLLEGQMRGSVVGPVNPSYSGGKSSWIVWGWWLCCVKGWVKLIPAWFGLTDMSRPALRQDWQTKLWPTWADR